jgi:spermidine synthase
VRLRTLGLLLLFFVSGASALIYEVVWTRQLTLHFGATALSLAAVLSAYMTGLALGSTLLARFARRISRPLAVYGLLELGVALIALAVPPLLDALSPLLAAAYGPQGPTPLFELLRFAIAFVVLLPLTMMMGATLPALAEELTDVREQVALHAGRAYAINTLGAMTGALVAGFFLIRWLGMRESWWVAVGLNAAIGLLALALSRTRTAVAPSDAPAAQPEPDPVPVRAVIALVASAGFCSLAYELLWTRYFINSFNSTVAAFSTILIAYLLGLGLGAFAASALTRRQPVTFNHLAALQGAVALMAVLLLGTLDDVPKWYSTLIDAFGSRLFARALLAVVVMIVPTSLMGMALPLGVHLLRKSPGAVGTTVGTVQAASSVGSALGPLGAALVLLPLLGLSRSILAVAVLQAVLAAALSFRTTLGSPWVKRTPALLAAATAALAIVFALMHPLGDADSARVLPMNIARAAPGQQPKVLCYRESPHGTTVVVDDTARSERTLYIDGFAASSNSLDANYMRLMGHLPMLMAPDPKNALVICLGTGITTGSVSLHQPERLDVAELNPEVVACNTWFDDRNGHVLHNPATHVVIDDGRNFLQMTPRKYDVITLEPLPPFFAGTVSLYSKEFNQLARSHLTEQGVFAQWLPLHLVTDSDARMIVRAISEVFPHVEVFKLPKDGCAIVLASMQPLKFQPGALEQRPKVLQDLSAMGLTDVAALERDVVLSEEKVAAYDSVVPPVTDDHPWLEYRSWGDEYRFYEDRLTVDNIRALRRAGGLTPDESP